jgi:lipoic acid synthetase
MTIKTQRLPDSFKQILVRTPQRDAVERALRGMRLFTVCEEARCPNRNGCYARGTATFLVMGPHCSRSCAFCAIAHTAPVPLDPDEPQRVAAAVSQLGLRYAVITSVTRDDLPDGGAGHFVRTIAAVRAGSPGTLVEVLTPDFQGDRAAVAAVIAASPDVFNHNLETIERLYPRVRPQAGYRRSLDLIAQVKAAGLVAKSGIMVGLGETVDEVASLLRDLAGAGCDLVTVGQYLAPSPRHLPVARFWTEEEYADVKSYGESLAPIKMVLAGPLVRSSYHAQHVFEESV